MLLRSRYPECRQKFLLGVLCIIECPVQLIEEVFWKLLLPRFEALAYVLPHVVIYVSLAFIFQTFAEVCCSFVLSDHL